MPAVHSVGQGIPDQSIGTLVRGLTVSVSLISSEPSLESPISSESFVKDPGSLGGDSCPSAPRLLPESECAGEGRGVPPN